MSALPGPIRLLSSILPALCWSLIAIHAQEAATQSLDALRNRFSEQRLLLEKPVTDLNQLYEKQLAALREKVKGEGDLEKTLVVDQEIRDYQNPDHAPGNRFAEIDRLREIYRTELQKRRAEVASVLPTYLASYLEQLNALSKELTRQDRLQEAVAVRDEATSVQQLIADSSNAPGIPSAAPQSPSNAGGRMNGIGFGNKEDPLGIPPRGITDVVSIKYWERETFDTGWVALRANGMVLTDQERRVSSTQDRIIAFDCSAAGILMVREDGTIDGSLCKFQVPEEQTADIVDLVDVTLGRNEGPLNRESAVGVKKDGSLVWWGPGAPAGGDAGPPDDARRNIATVVSGRGVFTALRKDGRLVVWKSGEGSVPLPAALERDRFQQVVMSEQHTLALKENGEVVAWGQNSEGQCDVPADLGPCTEVRVLHNVLSLARKRDGTWAAWGRDYGGLRDRLQGTSKKTHVLGRLFPPGQNAYAVWIETAE